jgi:hypothetical protein
MDAEVEHYRREIERLEAAGDDTTPPKDAATRLGVRTQRSRR